MQFPKTINLGLPLSQFLILFFLVLTDTFYLTDALPTSSFDRILFYIIHISFWFSTAFLFNTIVNKFYWGGINKVPVGNMFLLKLKDFIAVLVYAIIIVLVLVKYFAFTLSFELIGAALLFIFIGMLIRPSILCFFRSIFFSNSLAFNIGDWIKLDAINSNTELIGEVINVDRRNLKIKTEDNNIITIPQNSLNDFVIENFWGSGREARFEVEFLFNFKISPIRVKRILLAAARQAIEEYDFLSSPQPEVMLNKITTSGLLYKAYFWIIPWEKISPTDAKDKILMKAVEYLNKSGISFSLVEGKDKSSSLDTLKNIKSIISGIELFDTLSEDEVSEIAEDVTKREFTSEEIVIKENEDGDSMFLVVEGLLDVFVSSSDKYQLKVGRLVPGDFFGEMSLMTGEKRSATVKAATDVLVLEITKENISKIIGKREKVINEFGEIISRRSELNIQQKEEYEKSQHSFIEEIVEKIKRFFRLN